MNGYAVMAALAVLAASVSAAGVSGIAHPEDWPLAARAVPQQAQTEEFVEHLLSSMTLEEKVGQLIQADIDSVTPNDLARYHLGSILAGGNAAPGGDIHSTGAQWLDLTDSLFRASVQNTAHTPIPILFGIDAVHGHAKVRGATIFPHNVGLGATHDPALIQQIGKATAQEVAATGIDWTFAPTIAVVRDVRWGRSYESYSEDPALVCRYASSMVTGLQGELGSAEFLRAGHTLASAKHFLGDGGTLEGRDQFNNTVPEHTLRDIHGAAYVTALAAGDLIVMASYNSWQGLKMHANQPLLTGVLKERWNFPGFIVGDWNAQEEIPGCTKYSCPQFLAAGGDMYMAPDSWKLLYANLLKQIAAGRIAQSRVDDAVRRILRVKVLAGVFHKKPPKERQAEEPLQWIGSASHRQIARLAVRESLVLLKNNHHTLPLDAHSNILVTGPGADDIGMQSGGWTVDWQGNHNSNGDFPGATSILQAIRAAVAEGGGRVVTRLETAGAKPDVAIVVYGETPYAEFQGDRETLELPDDDAHLEMLRKLHAAKVPVVSLFISGRPMWVNRELNLSAAFVALWLPGSEGEGVADLLFKHDYDFTGRLSFSWPAGAMPVTFDATDHVQGALFARGFGLSLAQPHELGPLPEDPLIPATARETDTFFHGGHVTAPWSIYVSDPVAEVRLTTQSQASPQTAVQTQLGSKGIQVEWTGNGSGEFRIGGRAVNLPADSPKALRLHYRVESAPREKVILSMRCEPTKRCGLKDGTGVDLTTTFRVAGKGTWATLTVPLRSLTRTPDLVAAPVVLETSGPFRVSFDDIRWVQ